MTWTEAFQTHPGEMLLWTAIMGAVALGFLGSFVAALVFRGNRYPRRYDDRYRYEHPHRRERWEQERRVRLPHRGDGPQVPIHAYYRGGPGIAA